MELAAGEVTIAQLLQRAGYATAHFGKWHCGRANPREHGYAENDGANGTGGPDDSDNPNPKQLFLTTERGIDFMARQAQAGKPFYLQLDHYAARRGGAARPESVALAKSWGPDERDLETAAADWDLDLAFGMLLKKLDDLGIASNTYVIFTTDHGTPGRNPPFAGGKGTVSEGGLRVPFIIRGPGIKAGVCSRVRIVGADIFPTMAELAHINGTLPKGIEGGSFAGVLANGGTGVVKRTREEYVIHFPHYDKDEIGPASALYLGDFKLIRVYETGALKLFNIAKDPGERHDLAREMPDKVKELNQRLTNYLTAVNAQMPSPNPNYDPSKPPPEQKRGGKGMGGKKNR
jgi:arylsulfatase A-like enzyme